METKNCTGGARLQDTAGLLDDDARKWREDKARQEQERRAATEAKMQMWLKAAAEKKAREAAGQ